MKKGEIYTGIVEKMDFPNKGILYIEDEKVMVKHGLPGQTLKVVITKQRKGKCEARILDVISRSPLENLEEAFNVTAGAEGSCSYYEIGRAHV